jgi:calcium-dependent protein kinase
MITGAEKQENKLEEYIDINTKYYIPIYSRELGRGCNTIVRKCIQRGTGARFAVKSSNNPEQVAQMKREVALLKKIDHANVLKVIETVQDKDAFYLVTELCKGGEVYYRVVKNPYNDREAARIVSQLLDAIKYCHARHIVHRDLKLENILLTNKNHHTDIKIIDFGLASDQVLMTERVGTTNYVAPEVLDCCYTDKCDVWSIGVIAYTLLTATAPFSGSTDDETFKLIRTQPLTFSDERISESAQDFIESLLQKDPSLRPSAAQASTHVWLHQEQQATVPPPPAKQRFNLFKRMLKLIKVCG